MNIQIQKQALQDEALIEYMQKAAQIGALGYKGLDIAIFKNPVFPHTRLFHISGLGSCLAMLYIYKSEEEALPVANVCELFADFTDFIIYEREENGQIQH